MNKIFWSSENVEYLIKNFENTDTITLSNQLKISPNSVSKKAKTLKLRKNKDYLAQMVKDRNKIINSTRVLPPNRNLTNENLGKIALQYKTRYEFQMSDSRAYSVCCRRKILDTVCSHMINKRFSIPQLFLLEILKILFPISQIKYNDRKEIKPYEIDIFLPEYNLAFEYNGKYWHKNNKNDNIKRKLCIEKNISLIVIDENTKDFRKDIKTQLIDNLIYINNLCGSNISITEINNIDHNKLHNSINNQMVDEIDVKKIVSNYTHFSDFRKYEFKTYEMLVRFKLLDKYTKHLIRSRINWNVENITKLISKYDDYNLFIKENVNCYKYIMSHKLNYLCTSIIKKSRNRWNETLLKNEIVINKYKTVSEFCKKCSGGYKFAITNNLMFECKQLILNNKI